MTENYDIIIAGGGLAGASLACALMNQDFRIALIEPVTSKAGEQPSYDDRGLALSMSSRRILQKLDVWSGVASNPIRKIHVSDRGRFGFVRLHADDLNIDALGHVVIARELGQALLHKISQADNIDIISPAQAGDIRSEYSSISVSIDGGGRTGELTGKLLVAADGSNSRIRQELGIATREKDYKQTAVVTNVTLERPRADTAYERFTESGPIALLPLGGDRCVLVYTVSTAEAESCLELDMNAFLDLVWRRFGRRLGRFTKMGAVKLYPLRLIEPQEQVFRRIVLLGNSAHTIHPNGAQGFNLCLRDVAGLAEHLVGAQREGRDIGDKTILDAYLATRIRDQQRVLEFSDRLASLFYNRRFPRIFLRNTGMLLIDIIPALKRLLIRSALGMTGDQPAMVRGD